MVGGALIVLAVLAAAFFVAFALEMRAARRRQREALQGARVVAPLPSSTGRPTGDTRATNQAATG
jgi:hypothetical protein